MYSLRAAVTVGTSVTDTGCPSKYTLLRLVGPLP